MAEHFLTPIFEEIVKTKLQHRKQHFPEKYKKSKKLEYFAKKITVVYMMHTLQCLFFKETVFYQFSEDEIEENFTKFQ